MRFAVDEPGGKEVRIGEHDHPATAGLDGGGAGGDYISRGGVYAEKRWARREEEAIRAFVKIGAARANRMEEAGGRGRLSGRDREVDTVRACEGAHGFERGNAAGDQEEPATFANPIADSIAFRGWQITGVGNDENGGGFERGGSKGLAVAAHAIAGGGEKPAERDIEATGGVSVGVRFVDQDGGAPSKVGVAYARRVGGIDPGRGKEEPNETGESNAEAQPKEDAERGERLGAGGLSSHSR